MKTAEAALIAGRRTPDIIDSIDEEACFTWLHLESGQAGPLWLCAAPTAESHEASEFWSSRGNDVALLASRQLALGNLVRILPDAPESGLTAILNLDANIGTCVICDGDGWVFGREFPLYDMSEEVVGPEGGPPDPDPYPDSGSDSDIDLDPDPDALELVETSAQPTAPEAGPAFGMLDIWAMRLATEMRRTFRYVEGELALGTVTRLWVSGSSSRISEICPLLSSRLEMPSTPVGDAIPDSPNNAAAVAIGLALWPNETGGNLLPRSMIEARTRTIARRQLLSSLGSVSAILVLAAVAMTLFENRLNARMEELDATFEAARPDRVTVAEHVQTRARVAQLDALITSIDHPLPSLSGLLALLSRATPDTVHVERVRIAHQPQGWTLELEVEAAANSVLEAASAVSELSNALKHSPLAELDTVVQKDDGRMITQPGAQPHVRFHLDGRLAPLSTTAKREAANRTPGHGVGDA